RCNGRRTVPRLFSFAGLSAGLVCGPIAGRRRPSCLCEPWEFSYFFRRDVRRLGTFLPFLRASDSLMVPFWRRCIALFTFLLALREYLAAVPPIALYANGCRTGAVP